MPSYGTNATGSTADLTNERERERERETMRYRKEGREWRERGELGALPEKMRKEREREGGLQPA